MNTMKQNREHPLLPVEIVLHPSWWHAHAGIVFDEDFFYHPVKRVESERRMEAVLRERFGAHGLGADSDRDLPVIGPVHNAAGYLLSEMLGCEIRYHSDAQINAIFETVAELRAAGEEPMCRGVWQPDSTNEKE